MLRPDLAALTPDDLAALANRGLLKRAQKELESDSLSATWEEGEDGTLRATWSDGVICLLPGGKTVKDASCSCGALELCRHVLRTVLAWQTRAEQSTSSGGAESKAWDPGSMSDTEIEQQVPKATRTRAENLWSQGVLVELLRSAKPSARFHCPGHTIRFPVPNDLRYAQCSCADPAPCVHALLAVRAFRLLAPEVPSGIISQGPLDGPVPDAAIAAVQECLRDLFTEGFASLGTAWRDRVRRVAMDATNASLIWPAQILEELADDFDRYAARDASFTPVRTLERLGELLLRLDAIRAPNIPVPQAFVRGMRSDRDADLGAARFIGLGASAVEERGSSALTVYLQDCDNGHVVTLMREFKEDPQNPASRKEFHQLARAPAVKDASLAILASGQLVTQGGRRKASGRLLIGRARAVVNPQNYTWETLKAPVLVDDFAEVAARLRLLPPASFRPRRAAADFHVCPLATIEDPAFDARTNSIVATLRDRAGTAVMLSHPWTERGRSGAEALLNALQSTANPLFVAGHIRAAGSCLIINPTALVLSRDANSRQCILPAIESSPATSLPRAFTFTGNAGIESRYRAATESVGNILLNGIRRTNSRDWPGWSSTVRELEQCGYHRMATAMSEVQSSEDRASAFCNVLKLLRLALDSAA